MAASLAVHDRNAPDDAFIRILPTLKRESTDSRGHVSKAVDWALRQIGKRSVKLRPAVIGCAREMRKLDSSTARRKAANVIRELESNRVRRRLGTV